MKAQAADYELARPASLASVLALMAGAPGEYMPIAGGTELMVQFGAGRLRARKLVDIFGLAELTEIEVAEHEITVGSGVTYTALRRSAEVARELPLLVSAAAWTGAIANQNRGTLGGNIVNGSPAADTPPALLAYGAEISLASVRGVRRLAYDEFHTGYKQNVLAPDELVLALHFARRSYTHSYLRKVGARNAQAISKVALGAVANVKEGRVIDCRIGLASVSHSPYRCVGAEAVLDGADLSADTIAKARAALLVEIAPLDDIRSTGKYRAHVSANLLEQFLRELGAMSSTALEQIKLASDEEWMDRLLGCCGSRTWAARLMRMRAIGLFASAEAVLQGASEVWFGLAESDWLEAFACHPRIGETRPAATGFLTHSLAEQAAAQETLEDVATKLLEGNRAYEAKFGFLYIVFASGRTAPELLAVLEQRLKNTRAEELQEAARQQDRITRLRLERWLSA